MDDFVKIKEKFSTDWNYAARDADLKIENVKHRVTEEYTTNQLDSVKNYWKLQNQNINESDNLINNYLRGSDRLIEHPPIKSQTLTDAVESDNYIQSYLDNTESYIHEVFVPEKDVIDSVAQSDQFIQSYLDGDRIEENEFQKKNKLIEDAMESDIYLEKYLL